MKKRTEERDSLKLYEAEYRFASLVWEHEPLGSGELAKYAGEALGWKRTTSYTVLKKLCTRGILQNQDSVVTSLVKREQVQRFESQSVVDRAFDGSLPQFIAAFLTDRHLSAEEAEKLKKMIDQYQEE